MICISRIISEVSEFVVYCKKGNFNNVIKRQCIVDRLYDNSCHFVEESHVVLCITNQNFKRDQL